LLLLKWVITVQPCGHASNVRRSARVSPRTDSVTGGYRRLTHLRLVTAHAHDVLLVPLWLTDCVCSCAAVLLCSHTRFLPPNNCRFDSCPTRSPSTPRRDYAFHLRDWRYAAISLGARVGVRGDTPTLKAIEPPPSAPPTPRRYAGGRREARPTHPSLVADGRHPPRERRAETPSRGGAILGSLCPPNRQMASV
jgi:hypothetical protein